MNILSSAADSQSLAERTLKATELVFPDSTMTAFDGFDTEGDYVGYYWYSPPGTVSQERVHLFGQLVHEHPYYLEGMQTIDQNTFRTSDFVALSKFHRTELFNEFYRTFGGDAQMGSAMRLSPKCLITCSVHRPKIDFSDREVESFALLTSHLKAAFKNARAFERVETERNYLESVMKQGLVVIDSAGEIKFISETAKRLLETYFADFAKDKLPEELSRLISAKGTAWSGNEFAVPVEPFTIAKNGTTLFIRFAFNNGERELTMLMEEKAERNAIDFRRLGLTARESEILLWMSRGKTFPEIASLCSISLRTVEKHSENLYTKLGVETGTAAVLTALEKIDS